MNLKVDKAGFSINERRYNVGDVLCYPNQNIKGILLFGFYDNGLSYEDNDCGCGFYTMTCDLVDGKWVKDGTSQSSITTYFNSNIETDEKIINEVRALFDVFCLN